MGSLTPEVRRWLVMAGIALALLAGGYSLGRYVAPDKVVTKDVDVVRTVTVEDTQAKEQVRQLTEALAIERARTHIEYSVIVRKDGTKEAHVVADRRVDKSAATESKAVEKAETHEVKATEAVHEVVHEKLVERARPQWTAGVVVLVDPNQRWAPSIGVTATRHIVGPLSLGVFAAVPVQQPLKYPLLGVSATLDF